MTNEEAIEVLENGAWWDLVGTMPCDREASVKFHAALDVGIAALRAQQTPATLDRSRWEGCNWCIWFCPGVTGDPHWYYRFCPICGRPLIEEAWAELERRINGG